MILPSKEMNFQIFLLSAYLQPIGNLFLTFQVSRPIKWVQVSFYWVWWFGFQKSIVFTCRARSLVLVLGAPMHLATMPDITSPLVLPARPQFSTKTRAASKPAPIKLYDSSYCMCSVHMGINCYFFCCIPIWGVCLMVTVQAHKRAPKSLECKTWLNSCYLRKA